MTKDINDLYSERVEIDPTYGDRVREAQWSTFDGSDDWDMTAAFIAAVKATEVRPCAL